jgi:hypothetical protein
MNVDLELSPKTKHAGEVCVCELVPKELSSWLS